jgi:hypothetical protein
MHYGHARRLLALSVIVAGVFVAARPHATPSQPDGRRWYRGNTHTHTLNSDGDSTPDEVVRWYRENGYHFLVLSDHNFLTQVDTLNALHGADNRFLVVKGEEVTDHFGDKPIHVNGINVKQQVPPQGGSSVLDVVQRNVDVIRGAGGVPHLNHPNFGWAVSADELRQVERMKLFEVFNGHPQVNNVGGGGVPGLEEAWDAILSTGRLLYGIATDDAHTFKRPWARDQALPGKGWIWVRAKSLEAAALLEAMERGEFYASTGVELSEYSATPTGVRLSVKTTGTTKFRVQFVGRQGRVLKEVVANPAEYAFVPGDAYVRARVLDSNGGVAWTQPVMAR